jgi:hypothetical protein
VEPTAAAAAVLVRLIGIGLGASAAHDADGIGKEEAELVQKLLDAGIGIAGQNPKDEPRMTVRYIALHA